MVTQSVHNLVLTKTASGMILEKSASTDQHLGYNPMFVALKKQPLSISGDLDVWKDVCQGG